MHTTLKGDISVMRVIVALMQRGETVLRPVSEYQRYDLALDRGGSLYRIQAKTGCVRNGCIVIRVHSSPGGKGCARYTGQVEAIGVFCPQTDTCYLIPMEMVGGRTYSYLRVEPPRNHQRRKILLAADYII